MLSERLDAPKAGLDLGVSLRKAAILGTSSGLMSRRYAPFCGLVCLLVALCGGCKKSAASQSQPPPWANEPVVTLHWSGIKHLSTDPTAAEFLKIWHLPETGKLLDQTLDKLALAPWRLSGTNPPPAVTNFAAVLRQNHSASLLRPLLEDLAHEEFYLEVRDQNGPELALAVHLERARGGVWESNLANVLESASGTRRVPVQAPPGAQGWRITGNSGSPSPWLRQVELSRLGDWTIVGFGSGQNHILSSLLNKITSSQGAPFGSMSKAWLQTAMDLRRASRIFSWGWDLPQDWPKITLALSGDGQNVLTRGTFDFAQPLPFQIEPWNIPTNLVHEPLHSFTAVQGVSHWLGRWSWWENMHAGTPPNQIFSWGQSGSPFLDYAAASSLEANRIMNKLGPKLMESMNPMLATNRMGKWERATNSDGVEWHAPVIAPFVRSSFPGEGHYLVAGLSPLAITNSAPPRGTFKELLTLPNVVYYDREITGPRVEAWLYISQIFRIIFRRAQLPPEALSIAWLRAVAPLMGNSTTFVTKSGPTSLAFNRTSTLGLTGMEVHVVVDWLESQEFPARPHSLVAKLRPPPTALNAKPGK